MRLTLKLNLSSTQATNDSTYIYNINLWARLNPLRVFDDDFKAQRLYLDDETWRILLDLNPDIKVGDRKYNILPAKYRAELERANVRNTIEEKGAPIAGALMMAATAPLWAPYANRLFQISKWGSKSPGIWGRMPSLSAVESTVSRPWLTPGLGKLADASVLGYFAYQGAKGYKDQYENGTLNFNNLENLSNTVLNGAAILPAALSIKEVPALFRVLRPKTLGRNLFRQYSRMFPGKRVKQLQLLNEESSREVSKKIVQNFAENNLAPALTTYKANMGILEDYLQYGDFSWPNYTTGEYIKGNIPKDYTNYGKLGKLTYEIKDPAPEFEPSLGDIDIKFLPFETHRGNSAGDIETLRKVLQNNILFLENHIPGSKVYGSSRSVADGAITLIPKDMEVMLTEDAFNAFKVLHPEARIGAMNSYGTAKYYMNPSWGEHGVIDLNIISVDNLGYGNKRAMSIYLLYFPREYLNTVRLISEGKITPRYGDELPMLDMEGKPMTALLLIEAYNPEESTILDSFLSNFTIDRKAKHRFRSLEYLSGGRPDLVHRILQRYSNMITGGRGRLLPPLTFGTEAENQALLRSIGLKGDITTIALDPVKMLNALDAWYLTESGMAGRSVAPGDIGEGRIASWDKTLRNFSKWLYTGQGGSANGFGLNWTAGADSQAPRLLKGYLLPYIKGLFNGMRAEDAVQILKRAMLHPDYKLTQEEADVFNTIYAKHGVLHGQEIKAGDNGFEILRNTQQSGKNVYEANKEISLKLGFNFATGQRYNYHGLLQPYYIGSMRDFNLVLGTPLEDILGVARYDGTGAFEYMPSWRDRFDLHPYYMPWLLDLTGSEAVNKANDKLYQVTKARHRRNHKLFWIGENATDRATQGIVAGIVSVPFDIAGAAIASSRAGVSGPYSFGENLKFYDLAHDLGGEVGLKIGRKGKDTIVVNNLNKYYKLPLWLRNELLDRFIISPRKTEL